MALVRRLPQPITATVVMAADNYQAGCQLTINRATETLAGPVGSNQFVHFYALNKEAREKIRQQLTDISES